MDPIKLTTSEAARLMFDLSIVLMSAGCCDGEAVLFRCSDCEHVHARYEHAEGCKAAAAANAQNN